MKTAITLIIAIIVTILHLWLCRRSPKRWYLGGIIPTLWIVSLLFLLFNGKINFAEDWNMVVFPTLILLLAWIDGQQAAKKKEIAKMKAQDIQAPGKDN